MVVLVAVVAAVLVFVAYVYSPVVLAWALGIAVFVVVFFGKVTGRFGRRRR